jgi:hypothetical protein
MGIAMPSPTRFSQLLPVLLVAVIAGGAAGVGHFNLSWNLIKPRKCTKRQAYFA